MYFFSSRHAFFDAPPDSDALLDTETSTSRAAFFRSSPNSEHGWDNLQLIAGTRSTTETFTYNNANEQLTHAKNGVTTTMTYDDWGRLSTRDDGTHDATYAYRYGSKLYNVTSDFPGEGNVTYETGGDGKQRSRVAGAEETWYNYTIGFDVVSTENDAGGSAGTLTMTSVLLGPSAQVSATLADLAGTTPTSGAVRYYATDKLGTNRTGWNGSKVAVGAYEFDPYGGELTHTGAALSSLAGAYTGRPWDSATRRFHFPFREYSPDIARWTTRDPLGMVDGPNRLVYVLNSPISKVDLLGLFLSGGDIGGFVVSMFDDSPQDVLCNLLGDVTGVAVGAVLAVSGVGAVFTGIGGGAASGFTGCMCKKKFDPSKAKCCKNSAIGGAVTGLFTGGLAWFGKSPVHDFVGGIAGSIWAGNIGGAIDAADEDSDCCR